MHIKAKLYPYPVLASFNNDYLDSSFDIEVEEITWIAPDYITLEGDDLMLFERLMGMLEEDDDVQDVYHNVNA